VAHHQPAAVRALPEHPDLRHLKDQARDLHRAGAAPTRTAALHRLAREYGFASWARLKAHVESRSAVGQLKQAIDRDDLATVQALMSTHPDLHTAPIGYGNNGPLTWVAECRHSAGAPSPERLAIAEWMLTHGSDVHQGGDGPLMRAALRASRIPMMALLVRHGANVNAQWNGRYPILFAPCETVDPEVIAWLLSMGAIPDGPPDARETPLDYLLGSYVRSPQVTACIDALVAGGGTTRFDIAGVVPIVRGDLTTLSDAVDRDPAIVHQRLADLDIGATGARRLTLRGATLLHVAAEFGQLDAVRFLLDRGADVNARATMNDHGTGGQTALFHAATQFDDAGYDVAALLLARGAHLDVAATLPGHYERPDETVTGTALNYARLFPGDDFPGSNRRTIDLLTQRSP
jgi:hypothetical protein